MVTSCGYLPWPVPGVQILSEGHNILATIDRPRSRVGSARMSAVLGGTVLAAATFLTTAVGSAAADVVIDTVTVEEGAGGVAITPDGAYAYVANQNGNVANQNGNSVSVIATATNTVTATIPVGEGPSGMAITPNGAFAYVTNLVDNSVSVIDTATNTEITTVPIGGTPSEVAITPDGALAYVTNIHGHSVSVIDTATNTVITSVPVGNVPFGVAFTPNGALAYVANFQDDSVSVIDTATNTVVTTVLVGDQPIAVAFTPDGALAYVTHQGDNSVSVIDTATSTVVTTVLVGDRPNGIAITPDGALAYVANYGAESVSVIDTSTNMVATTIAVGDRPSGVAITPNGTHAYVTNWFDGTVSVIEVGIPAAITGAPVAGVVGEVYEHTFEVTGSPVPTVAVTAGDLPEGLVLSEQGVLSGTPTAAGTYQFTVTASNGVGEDAVLDVTLEVGQVAGITGAPAAGVVGEVYEHVFEVTGSPAPTVSVTAGDLPDGLVLSEQGVLSGTPAAAGTFEFTVTATNGVGDDAVLDATLDVTAATEPGSSDSWGSSTGS
ncbi:YncE family protein [Rhodococcus sp. NPDC049939]|uniref:YncE family protein n=1 Tax=Rhodococcus sp. NPDC049939 TaxID=3155511 RepID=UPI0033D8B819